MSNQIENMTPEEIRVKVSELCGWKFEPANGPLALPWRHPTLPDWNGEFWSGRAANVPNYPSDLNACAEFERELTEAERVQYTKQIGFQTSNGWANMAHISAIFPLIHASALQRCKAFILTKGGTEI